MAAESPEDADKRMTRYWNRTKGLQGIDVKQELARNPSYLVSVPSAVEQDSTAVWNYFKRVHVGLADGTRGKQTDWAECISCNNVLSAKSGSVTALRAHTCNKQAIALATKNSALLTWVGLTVDQDGD